MSVPYKVGPLTIVTHGFYNPLINLRYFTLLIIGTPLKFNMEPEKKSLEKEIPFGNHHFQVPAVKFQGSRVPHFVVLDPRIPPSSLVDSKLRLAASWASEMPLAVTLSKSQPFTTSKSCNGEETPPKKSHMGGKAVLKISLENEA